MVADSMRLRDVINLPVLRYLLNSPDTLDENDELLDGLQLCQNSEMI